MARQFTAGTGAARALPLAPLQTGESFLLMFASRVSNIKQIGARARRVKILEKVGSESPPPPQHPQSAFVLLPLLPHRRIASPYLVL